MKIVFNDATELTVQKVYTDSSGALRIKTISATEEEIKAMFSDDEKTKRIIVQERKQTIAEYEGYVNFDGITKYNAGIIEPFLYREGETTEEKMAKLEAENADLKEQLAMVTECILEVSELVYQ